MAWYVYVLRCSDGSLYTGVTTDLERRVAEHNGGQGARYTRGRGPMHLIYHEACSSRAEALRREHAIKQQRRSEKEALADGRHALPGGHPDR